MHVDRAFSEAMLLHKVKINIASTLLKKEYTVLIKIIIIFVITSNKKTETCRERGPIQHREWIIIVTFVTIIWFFSLPRSQPVGPGRGFSWAWRRHTWWPPRQGKRPQWARRAKRVHQWGVGPRHGRDHWANGRFPLSGPESRQQSNFPSFIKTPLLIKSK